MLLKVYMMNDRATRPRKLKIEVGGNQRPKTAVERILHADGKQPIIVFIN